MQGLKTASSYFILIVLGSSAILLTIYFSMHNIPCLMIGVLCALLAVLGIYGNGYFSGWIASHEESRTIYRHEE